jgi:hypothetical protein
MRTLSYLFSPSDSYKSSPAKLTFPIIAAFNVLALAVIFVRPSAGLSRRNLTAAKIGNLGYNVIRSALIFSMSGTIEQIGRHPNCQGLLCDNILCKS